MYNWFNLIKIFFNCDVVVLSDTRQAAVAVKCPIGGCFSFGSDAIISDGPYSRQISNEDACAW